MFITVVTSISNFYFRCIDINITIMTRPFKSELVVGEQINTSGLRAYHIGFDQKKFRLGPLVDVIRSVIPEFSLGYIANQNIDSASIIDKLKEAAETVFTTDKYQKRGEFGELILHFLLRDFHNTIPLVSKIWFKDSLNVAVHGFDGVQVSDIGGQKKLWLGESKLYKSGKDGIKDLIKDIKKHVNADYIRSEFSLITRKIPDNFPDLEHWRQLMHKQQKLDVIFSSIVIPMVCTYTSDVFKKHNEETPLFLKDFNAECLELHNEFTQKMPKTNIEIILLLLPVENKDELNKEIYERLKKMQGI